MAVLRTLTAIGAVAALVLGGGCGEEPAGFPTADVPAIEDAAAPDALDPGDVAAPDRVAPDQAGAPDAAAPDAAAPDDASADGGPPCEGVPTATLGAEPLTFDTARAADTPTDTPCVGTTQLTRVAAFRYTMRFNGPPRLSLGMHSSPTPLYFWVQTACDAADGRELLRCTDTRSGGLSLSLPRLTRGSTFYVYVAVGALSAAPSRYVIGVSEDGAELGLGDPCRPGVGICPTGSSCAPVGRCVAAGAEDGRCRSSPSPACDAGLTCDSATGFCVRGLPPGSPCDSLRGPPCATGSRCISDVCQVDGAADARCRSAEPRCDTGLYCERDFKGGTRCAPRTPRGGACPASPSPDPCIEGSHCVDRVCLADGGRDAACRDAGAACDAGLTCAAGRCVPAVALGGDCAMSRTGCPTGSECASTPEGALRCALPGAHGTRCRATAPACDAPFVCGRASTPRCVAVVAVGGACDPTEGFNVCAAGATCVSRVCVVEGAVGGACRMTSPRCNAGLGCVPATSRCDTALAVGAACSTFSSACAEGSSCQNAGGGSTRCILDGTLRGQCRAGSSCDAGLVCDAGRCRQLVAVGARCDPEFLDVVRVCGPDATCEYPAGMGDPICVARGALRGSCRATGAACDPGLRCNGGMRCVLEIPLGMPCDVAGISNLCPTGAQCIGFVGEERCRADGAVHGACRTGRTCDAGLACTALRPFLCLPPIPLGGACTFEIYPTRTCAPARCAVVRGAGACVAAGAPGGFCRTGGFCDLAASSCTYTTEEVYCGAVAGGEGGSCRASEPRCDAGLACNPYGLCRFAIADGGSCDILFSFNTCTPPARCVASGLRGTCTR